MINYYKKEQWRGLSIWLVILIVVAIIVIGVVTLTYILSQKTKKGPIPTPAETPSVKLIESAVLSSCWGRIEDIQDDSLKIKATKAENKLLSEDQSFEVLVNEQTEILFSPDAVMFQESNGTLKLFGIDPTSHKMVESQTQKISLVALKQGDYVVVTSQDQEEDIRNEESFEARYIFKIER